MLGTQKREHSERFRCMCVNAYACVCVVWYAVVQLVDALVFKVERVHVCICIHKHSQRLCLICFAFLFVRSFVLFVFRSFNVNYVCVRCVYAYMRAVFLLVRSIAIVTATVATAATKPNTRYMEINMLRLPAHYNLYIILDFVLAQ